MKLLSIFTYCAYLTSASLTLLQPVQAQQYSELCQHQGEKYLIGQRIMLPDYQTREVVWMTCTRSSTIDLNTGESVSRASWVVGITDGYRDDLLEQARLKAISAQELKQKKLLEQEHHAEKNNETEQAKLPLRATASKSTQSSIPKARSVVKKAIKKKEQKAPEATFDYSDFEAKKLEYEQKIVNRIRQKWTAPANTMDLPDCKASVFKGIKGSIVEVVFRDCPGAREYRSSVKSAILKSEPWPLPDIPELYQPEITITFSPPIKNEKG